MCSIQQPVDLINYLIKQQYISNKDIPLQQLHTQVQAIIKTQSQDLIRLRSQNLQFKKTIKQLQQKVSVQSCNSNNTESKFMLSSQFKTKFEEFMKQSLSLLIGVLLNHPFKYYETFLSIVKNYYYQIQEQFKSVLKELSKILKIQGEQKQLIKNVLKIIQDNHTKIFPFSPKKYYNNLVKVSSDIEIEQQEFNRIFTDYHNLVIYMILQQDQWQIVFGEEKQVQFNKKQFVCVDGWIKQKQKALVLIEGLRKGSGFHPNIKNYVIPIPKGYVKPIELPVMNTLKSIEKQSTDLLLTIEQEEKRIKTVEGPITSRIQNHFEASMQLEKKARKTSVTNLPMKVTVGKIVKQSSKIITDRKHEVESSKGKLDKKFQKQKQNNCLNVNSSKITNYKEIIKKKFIKQDNRSLMRSRQRLMCLYDSSVPSKTQRVPKEREGSSQNRKKKQENRPLKPSEQHIARFRAKHKLL